MKKGKQEKSQHPAPAIKGKVQSGQILVAVIVAIIIFCIVAVVFNVVPIDVFPSNFIGAILGALIGALITVLLLRGQTAIEEEKGKNIRILQKKTKIFKCFIKDIWDLWKEKNITIEKIRNLTSTYTDLIIYIKNTDRLKEIGDCLSKIGKSNDRNEILNQIISIINELSQELELGGTITPEIHQILLYHESLVSDLKKSFPDILLNALNEKLSSAPDSALEDGKYELFKEGYYELQYACFNFKQFKGCKIIIGPMIGGNHLQFALAIDLENKEVDNFRAKGSYRQRIEKSGANLRNPINGIGEILPVIDFNKEESMEYYMKNNNENAIIVAERAAYYFDSIKINNLNIIKFLEENVKKE